MPVAGFGERAEGFDNGDAFYLQSLATSAKSGREAIRSAARRENRGTGALSSMLLQQDGADVLRRWY